jgi:hypothetical protein
MQGGGRVREPWGSVPYKIDNTELERKGNETFMELETAMLTLQFGVTAVHFRYERNLCHFWFFIN